VVDSGVVGVEKPDPAIFAYALDALDLEPAQVWYLGDTVRYDAAGAEAAGLSAWIIDHGGHHTLPYPRRVTSLESFADAVLTGS
jgi:putative hydrolase of the HAD superfamily